MAAADPTRRIEIAARGGRRKAANDALREERTAEAANYILGLVDQAPPLTELQRARLAALLLGSRRTDEAVPA